MAGANESSIPKFSSFQPRKRVNTASVTQPSSSDGDAKSQEVMLGDHHVQRKSSRSTHPERRSSRERRHDRHAYSATRLETQQKKGDNYSNRHRERSPDRDARRRQERPCRETTVSDSYNHPADLFTIDTRGDPANLQYRRPNKWTVPLYHLYGSGSIVGLDPEIKIDRNLSDERGYTLRYPPKRQPQKIFESVESGDAFENDASVREDVKAKAEFECSGSEQADFLPMPNQKRDPSQSPEDSDCCSIPRLTTQKVHSCQSSRQNDERIGQDDQCLRSDTHEYTSAGFDRRAGVILIDTPWHD